MSEDKKIQQNITRLLKEEKEKNIETIWWLSFSDPDLSKGSRFLGVIITKALGFTHAMHKTHDMNINPGGEIQASEMNFTKEIIFDKLLSKDDLIKNELIDE